MHAYNIVSLLLFLASFFALLRFGEGIYHKHINSLRVRSCTNRQIFGSGYYIGLSYSYLWLKRTYLIVLIG